VTEHFLRHCVGFFQGSIKSKSKFSSFSSLDYLALHANELCLNVNLRSLRLMLAFLSSLHAP